MEQSPVGSSASNGVVERAIQSVEQHVRVLQSALEGPWVVKLETRHPAIPWVTGDAAILLNHFEVGHDGKTAYERNKGTVEMAACWRFVGQVELLVGGRATWACGASQVN